LALKMVVPSVEWGLALALAAPHLLYGFIWFFPQNWQAQFGKRSVLVFDSCAWVLKVVQFGTAIAWWIHAKAPAHAFDVRQLSPLSVVAGLAVTAAGQALNIGIFRAIGHVGVYYGFKLGHKVPWVEGFPFNVVSHPQYVGAVLSIWGVVIALWQQRPGGTLAVALYWTLLYVVTAIQESNF
jgi:methylene-fatty-acyl-phospholipid synthase